MQCNKSLRGKRKSPVANSFISSDLEWTPTVKKPKKTIQHQKFTPLAAKKQNASQKDEMQSQPRRKQSKDKMKEKEGKNLHNYRRSTERQTTCMGLTMLDDDDLLYCHECNREYEGDCPKHGPLLIASDSEVPPTCQRGKDPDYCRYTLPHGLVIKTSKIAKAGLGVFSTKSFPARTRFGPYLGRRKKKDDLKALESGYSWKVFRNEKLSHYIDAKDPKKSNWMRFVNCARFEEEQCVTAYQYKGQIYYRAYKDITPGTEILVYYGDSYAEELGIEIQHDTVELKKEVEQPQHDTMELTKGVDQPIQLQPSEMDATISTKDGRHKCFWCSFECPQYTDYLRHMKQAHSGQYSEKVEEEHSLFLAEQLNSTEPFVFLKTNNTGIENKVQNNIDACLNETSLDFRNTSKRADTETEICKDRKIFNGKRDFPVQVRVHKCAVCSKCFSRKSDLVWHERIHRGESPYKYGICVEGLTASNPLMRHKGTHSGKTLCKCDICGKGFTDNSHLITHKRIHSLETPYKCNVCGKRFSVKSNLVTHGRTHSGETPYKCDICNKGFTRSDTLVRHKKTHSQETPYKCDVCGKRFSRMDNLVTHKRVHSGETPYKCDVCGRRFTREDYLVIHKRTHGGEIPHPCNNVFANSLLVKHKSQMVHTGKASRSCDICGKGFTKSHLLKHKTKKIPTGAILDNCSKFGICGKGFTNSHLKHKTKKISTGGILNNYSKCDTCFCDKGFTNVKDETEKVPHQTTLLQLQV